MHRLQGYCAMGILPPPSATHAAAQSISLKPLKHYLLQNEASGQLNLI